MRVAILHDYLNQFGGAERVLRVLLAIFPEADLYTLLYDEARTRGLFTGRVTKTSFLDVPFVRRHHRAFIPAMPAASRFLSGRGRYDLVLSSSAGYAKGFRVNGEYHVSYCMSPLRYAWESEYLKGVPFTPWPLKKAAVYPVANFLKRWDLRAASRVNFFIAISDFIAGKVKRYYGRNAEVIHPPIDTATFYPEAVPGGKEYFLMVGRMLYYKRFDLGIQAFNDLKLPLKVVGRGPEAKKLQALAKTPYIEFIPNASDLDLRLLYSNARALIFPQVEDFGLVAAEALACGTPVIAFAGGGGPEIVTHRETGVLFNEQTTGAVAEAVRDFDSLKFNRAAIARRALRFSGEQFTARFTSLLSSIGFPVAS